MNQAFPDMTQNVSGAYGIQSYLAMSHEYMSGSLAFARKLRI